MKARPPKFVIERRKLPPSRMKHTSKPPQLRQEAQKERARKPLEGAPTLWQRGWDWRREAEDGD